MLDGSEMRRKWGTATPKLHANCTHEEGERTTVKYLAISFQRCNFATKPTMPTPIIPWSRAETASGAFKDREVESFSCINGRVGKSGKVEQREIVDRCK